MQEIGVVLSLVNEFQSIPHMAKEEASTASCTKREESKENVSTVWIVKEIGGQGEKSWLDKVGELADNNLRLFRVS